MISGGTAIPTRMPLLVARDREGKEYEIINFLLLGQDSDSIDQREGVFRTDTMIVLSVNLTTDTVAMISLPRDLYVYIPDWGMQRLNLAWGRGQAVGWTDGGFGLLRQTILYNLGIRIHYFAMVDFDGFKQIIERLNGVSIAVDCPIQDYRFTGNYDENNEPIFELVTLSIGVHEMDSITALFYARSRKNSSDFDRGRRQQQLLRAIWYEARTEGYLDLGNIPTLYNDLTQIVETNIPLDVMIQLAPLALSMEPNEVENHFFRLGYETTSFTAPDGGNVQLPNLAIIDTIRAFLIPPTENRLVSDSAKIEVYDNSNLGMRLDLVASERLVWEGLAPSAKGIGHPPTEYAGNGNSILIDYAGDTKGSSVKAIMRYLNIPATNYFPQPDPNRTTDIAVYLTDTYSSCFERDVIAPVATPPPATE
jgi:LCP family protein required for cell wall assembly